MPGLYYMGLQQKYILSGSFDCHNALLSQNRRLKCQIYTEMMRMNKCKIRKEDFFQVSEANLNYRFRSTPL